MSYTAKTGGLTKGDYLQVCHDLQQIPDGIRYAYFIKVLLFRDR